jgi:uncharacterized membrane protein
MERPVTQPESNPAPAPDAAEQKMRQIELIISVLLRAGVTISFIFLVAGVVISFAHHPDYTSSTGEMARLTRPGAAFPHTIPDVVSGLRHLRGRAFIMTGLLVLIATPVMRVAVSIVGFAYQSDRTYVVITSIVLVLLLLSFLIGREEG